MEHYRWQVDGPYVSDRERELVRSAFSPVVGRVLDLGCGHGATLKHLGEPEGAVGVDLAPERVAIARENLPRCRFEVGSATALPFPDGAFDQVVVRDVLHHLLAPEDLAAAVRECWRVLAPGGRIDVLEPSRNNPLILLHGLVLEEERGELRSTMDFLERLLAPRFSVLERHRYQALPIHRVLLHPTMGWPGGGRVRVFAGLIERIEAAAARRLPRWAWAYVHLRAVRRDIPIVR